uniref:Probable phosphoenolpyruvate synthase n=1 Tax=Cacopsylla melanoneura TaxID=428564 RepID=A0A8D8LR86_9HEMI
MCWASLFSYQSVQYRRKNGLKVSTSEMCVLIQELVPEVSSAGVLFSCDPVTGHPWTSVISCNYGLGLSVVAASCDPDTFTLTRDVASEYKVKHKKCGNKGNKTVFQGFTLHSSSETGNQYSQLD